MDRGYFERLSALDAAMVFLETDSTLMNVGLLAYFDAESLLLPNGRLDTERIRAHVVDAISVLPRHRQRLAFTPLEGHPIWVDAERFEVDEHIRFHRFEPEADDATLRAEVGEILAMRLDITRPLWDLHVLEGLAGRRFAIVAKLHHAMVDGKSALKVFDALFSPDPHATPPHLDPGMRPRPSPGPVRLFASELARRTATVMGVARGLVRPSRGSTKVSTVRHLTLPGLVEAIRTKTTLAVPTPLNPGSLGRRRSFAHLQVDLDALKRVKNALSGTVNDAILEIVTGGVRRYFLAHDFPPGRAPVNVVMPFDARGTGVDHGLANRVVPTLVRLPIDLPTPRERMRAIVERTQRVKKSGQVEGVAFLEDLANLAVVRPIAAFVKAATRFWAGNFIVTNVPGPKARVHLLSAPMLACYPVVPIMSNQAIGIALLSYAGTIGIGVLADPDLVPDVDAFVRDLESEVKALLDAAP